MTFLRLNGWTVPVAVDSATHQRAVEDGPGRSEQAEPILRPRRAIMSWEGQSVPLAFEEADALEGLLAGLGHRMPFDVHLFSTRGRGPLSTGGASIVAGGVMGGACASVTSLIYDLQRGPAPLLDRWTAMFFREEAGVFRHYVVRSDGAVWYEGARDDTVPVAAFLSVFDGFLALLGAPTRFDELVVLCFACSDSQAIAWASRMMNESIPFSSLPRLDADGELFGEREVEVLGDLRRGQPHESFSDGVLLPDGNTYFRNNGRRVPFALEQARAAPRAADTGGEEGIMRQETVAAENISGADVTLADTLNFVPLNAPSVLLVLNGAVQEQGAGKDYTVAGQAITWLAGSGTAVDMIATDVLIAYYSS